MKTIYKYTLEINHAQKVAMPLDAKILSLQVQDNKPVIWALVDPDAPTFERVFQLYATGGFATPMDDLKYIGTFQIDGFVGHFFEKEIEVVYGG